MVEDINTIKKLVKKLINKAKCCLMIPVETEFPESPKEGRSVAIGNNFYVYLNDDWRLVDLLPVTSPDLSPEHTTGSTSYAESQTKTVVLRIRNLGPADTVGRILFYVYKMEPVFSLSFNPVATTATVGASTFTLSNANLDYYVFPDRVNFYTKSGVVIPANGTIYVSLEITAIGTQGESSLLITTINPNSGREYITTNNVKISNLSIN